MADNQYLTSSGQALHQPAQDVQVQTPEQVNYTEKIKNAMTNKMMSLDNKITGAVVNKAGYDVYQHHKQIAQGYEEGKYFQGTGKFDVISNLVFKLTEATGMQEQAVALVAPFARDLIKATNNPMLKQLLGMATGGLLRAESAKKTKDISKVISKIEAVFDGVGAAAKLAIQGLSAVGGYVKGVVTDISSHFVTNTDDFFATMLSGAGFMGPFLKIAFPYLKQLAGLMKDGILLAGKWLLKGAFSPFKYLGKSLMSWIFKPKNEQTKAIDTQMALVSGMKTLNTAITLLTNVMGNKSSGVLSKVKEGTEKITEGHTLGKIEAAPTASLTTFFTGGFLRSKYAKAEGVTEGTNVVSVDKYNFNQATEMQGSLGGGHLKVDYEKIKKSKQESKEQQEPDVEVQANKHIEPIANVINKPETELLEPEKEKREKSETSAKTETKPVVSNNTTTVTNVNNPITNVANTSIDKSIKTENHVKNNFISRFIESLKSKITSTATKQAAVTKVTPTAATGVVSATTRINQPTGNISKSSSRIVDTSKAKSIGNVKEVVSTEKPTVIPATNLNEAEMSKVSSSVKATVAGQTKESKEVEKTASQTKEAKEASSSVKATIISHTKEVNEAKEFEKAASQTKEAKEASSSVKATTISHTKEARDLEKSIAAKRLTELSKNEKAVSQTKEAKEFKKVISETKESAKVSNLVKANQIKESKELEKAIDQIKKTKEFEKSIVAKRLTELSKKEKIVGQTNKTKETSVIKSIVTAPFKSIGVGFNNITALISSNLKSIRSTIASPFKLISTKFSEMTSLIGDKFKTLKVAFAKSFKSAIVKTKDILLSPFKLISTGFSKIKESATSLLKSTTAIITKPFKAVGAFTKSAVLKTASLFTKTKIPSATSKNESNESYKIDRTSLIESSKGAVKSNKFAELFKKSKEINIGNATVAKELSSKIIESKDKKSKEINIGNATVAKELSSKIIESKLEKSKDNNSQLTKVNTTKLNNATAVINNKASAIIKSTSESFKKALNTSIASKHVDNLVSSKIATHTNSNLKANNSKIMSKEFDHSDISNVADLKSTVTKSKFNQINGLTNTLKDTTSKSSVVILTQFNKLKDSIKSKILKVKDIMLSPFKLISAGVSKLKEKSKLILTTITKPFTAIKSVVKSGFSKVSSLFSNTDKSDKYKLTNSNIAATKVKQQILNSNESVLANSSKSHKHYNNVELLKSTESNLHTAKLHQLAKLSAESNNEITKSALSDKVLVNSSTIQSATAINNSKEHYAKSKEFNKNLIASNLSSVKHSAVASHSTSTTKNIEKLYTNIDANANVGHKISTKESILTNSIESAVNAINSEITSDKFIKFAKSIIIDSLKASSNILKSAVIESSNLVNSSVSNISKLTDKNNVISKSNNAKILHTSKELQHYSTNHISKLLDKNNVILKSNNVYSHFASKESQNSSLNVIKAQQSKLKAIESNLKESINTKFKESSKEAIASKIENANKSNSIISRALKSINVGFKSSISKLTSKLKLDKLNNVIKSSFMKIGSVVTSIGSKIKNSKLGKAVTNTIVKWKEKFNEGLIIGRAISSALIPTFKYSSKMVVDTVVKSTSMLVSNISNQFKSIADKLAKVITKDLPHTLSKVISNNTIGKEINTLFVDKLSKTLSKITYESNINTVDLSEFSDILHTNQTNKSSTKSKLKEKTVTKSNKYVESVNNTVKSAETNGLKETNISSKVNASKFASKSANVSINKTSEKSKEKVIDKSVKDLTVAINKSLTKVEKTKVPATVATVKLMHVSTKTLKDIDSKDLQIIKFSKQTVSGINRLANALTKRSGLFGWLSSLFSRSSKKDNSVSIFKKLANSIAKSFKSLKTIIVSPFKSIARGFTNLKTTVVKTMNSIKTKIVDTVTKPFKIMKSAYVNLKKAISNKVTTAVNSIKDKYNNIVDKSKEFILKAKQSSINLMKSAKDKFSTFATGFSSLFGGRKSQKIIKLTADKTISNSDNIVVKASNVELKESKLSKVFSNIGSKVKSLFSFGQSNESKEITSKSIVSKLTDKFKSFKMPKLSNPLSGLFGKKYSFDIKQADITATTVNVGSKSFLGKILSGLGSLVTGTLLLPFKMIGALFGGGNRKLIKISTELNKKFEVALLKLHQLSTTVSTLSKHIIDKDKVSIFDRIKSFAKLGLTKIANSKVYQKSKAFVSNIKDRFIGSSSKTSTANNVNISKLVTNNAKATDKLLQTVKSESKNNAKATDKLVTNNVNVVKATDKLLQTVKSESKNNAKEKSTNSTKALSVITNAIKTLTTKVESNVKSRSGRFKTSKFSKTINESSEKLASKFVNSKVGQRFKSIGNFIDKSSEKLASKFVNSKVGKFIESKFKFNKSETQSVNSANKLTGRFNSKQSTLSTSLISSNDSNKVASFKSKLSDINKTNIDLNHSVSSNNIKTAKYDSIIKPLVSAFNSFASTIKSLIKTVKSTEFNSELFTQFTKSNKLSKVITGEHKYVNTGINTNLKSANNIIKSERNLSKSRFATTKLTTNLNSVNNAVKSKSNLTKSAFVRVVAIKRNEATTNEHTSNVKSSRSEFFSNLADKITSFSNITKTNNVKVVSTSKESELTASKLTKSFTKAIESTQEKESFRQKVLERRQEQREIKREQRTNKLLEGILKNTKHAKTTKKSENSFLSKLFNFGKKLLFGPLGKILGLLGTGFALFKTLGGSILKSLFNVSKFIGSFAISGLFKFIKTLTSSLKSVGKFLWKGALKVGSTLATVVGSALSGLKSVVGKVASSVTKIVGGIWSATKTAAANAAKGTKHVVGKVWNATKTAATKTWDGAKFLANKISAMFKGSAELVKSKLSNVFAGTKEIVSSAFKSISTASKSILDSIKSTKVGNAVVNTTTKAWSSVKLVTTKITEMFKGASQLVQTKISSIFSGAKSLFSTGILNTITLSAKTLTSKISGVFKGTSELVRSSISNIFSGAKSLFSNGIIDAVTLSAKTITSKIGSIFNGVADLFKSGLQGMFKGLNIFLKGLFASVFTKIFDAFKITKPSWLNKLTGNEPKVTKPKTPKPKIKPDVTKVNPDIKTNVKPDVNQNINPNKFKTSETKVKPKEVVKSKVHETKVKLKPKVSEVKAAKTNIHEAKSKFKTNTSETKATVKSKVSEVNTKFKTDVHATKTANKVNTSETKATVKSKVSEVKLNTKTSINASKINNSVFDSKTGWFKKVEETAVKPVKNIVDKSKQTVKAGTEHIVKPVKNIVDKSKQTVKKVAEHIVKPINKVVDKSKQAVNKVVETVTQTVKKVTEHTVNPIKKVAETVTHNSKTASTILDKSVKVTKAATKGAKVLGGTALKIVGKVATPAFLMYDMYDKGFNVKDTFGVDTKHSTWNQRASQMAGTVANSLSLGLIDTKDFAKNLNVTLNVFKGLYGDSREDHIKKAPKIKLPYYLKVYDYDADTKTYILKDTKNGIMVYRRGNVYQIGKKYYNVAQGESILEAIGADKKLDAKKAQDIYKHILLPSVTSVLGASKYGYSYVAQYKNVRIPYGYNLKDKTYRIYGKAFDSIQSARKFLVQTMRYQLGIKSKVTQKEATKHQSINTAVKLNKKSESNAATVESINVSPTKDTAFMKSMTAEQLSDFKSKSEKEQIAIYDKWKSEHGSNNVNAVIVPLVNQTSKNTKVANAKFNQIVKEASHNKEFIKSLETKHVQFDKLSDQDKVKYYKTWYKNRLQQKQQVNTNKSNSGWFASIITKAKQLVSGAKKIAVKTKESAKNSYHKVVKMPILNKSFDFVKTMAKTAAATIILPLAASASMSTHKPSNNTTIQTPKYQQSNEYDTTIKPEPAKLVIKKYKTPKGHIQLDLKAPFNVKDLRHELIKHEGEVLHVYKDSLGYPTIGTGHLLPPKGIPLRNIIGFDTDHITKEQNQTILNYDIARTATGIYSKLPWLAQQPDDIQVALNDMAFNVGVNGLLNFKKTLSYIKTGNYEAASKEVLNSKWAKQVGSRSRDISARIEKVGKSIPKKNIKTHIEVGPDVESNTNVELNENTENNVNSFKGANSIWDILHPQKSMSSEENNTESSSLFEWPTFNFSGSSIFDKISSFIGFSSESPLFNNTESTLGTSLSINPNSTGLLDFNTSSVIETTHKDLKQIIKSKAAQVAETRNSQTKEKSTETRNPQNPVVYNVFQKMEVNNTNSTVANSSNTVTNVHGQGSPGASYRTDYH